VRLGDNFLEYQNWLKEELSPSSVQTYAAVIRTAFNLAVRKGMVLKNPTNNIPRVKVPESRIVWLNTNELNLLAKTPFDYSEELKKAFLFACHTGLRVSDLETLKWGEIEHAPLQIVKTQKKTEDSIYIPLSTTAWNLINDGSIHDHRSPVFPQINKTAHRHYVRLKQWVKSAGIKKKVGWHTARHTFAVLALEGGADIYTVSKLLGHKDVKTTQVYAQATDKMKRAAVDALPQPGRTVQSPTRNPHRPGRAQLRHPVPLVKVSLNNESAIFAVSAKASP
jgi:integrase